MHGPQALRSRKALAAEYCFRLPILPGSCYMTFFKLTLLACDHS